MNFVHDNLLFDWNATVIADNHVGQAADSALLRFAKAGNLPLITHEGRRIDGSIDWDARKIPARARSMGVRACSPREFYGDIDEVAERDDFLSRYKNAASKYLDSMPNDNTRLVWQNLLRWTGSHYSLILSGPGAPDIRDGFEGVPTRVE